MGHVFAEDCGQPKQAIDCRHHRQKDTGHTAKSCDHRCHGECTEMRVVEKTPNSNNVLPREVVQMLKAPIVDIDIFCGDPLEYDYFKANFVEVVEKTVEDQRGRLARLIKYTDKDAKELIKPFILGDAVDCYDRAMCLLDQEYGNRDSISAAYIKQLGDWPAIKMSDIAGLKKMHRFLLKCQMHKRQGSLRELDSATFIKAVVTKLDQSYHEKWRSRVESIKRDKGKVAIFDDLVNFIDFQACSANNPSYSREAMKETKNFRVHFKDISEHKPSDCQFCKETTEQYKHTTSSCPEFLAKSISNRHKMVFNHRLCFGCLQPISDDHYGKICPQRATCDMCMEQHPTCLHKVFKTHTAGMMNKEDHATVDCQQPVSKCSYAVQHRSSNESTSLCIVPVYVSHYSEPDHKKLVYALLDDDCSGCFCVQEVLEDIAPTHLRKACVSIVTLNGETVRNSSAVDNLVVSCGPQHSKQYAPVDVHLPTTYSCDSLPLNKDDMPTASSIKRWAYLQEVARCLPEFDENIPFGLMIGGNCPKALEPMQYIHCQEGGPYARRSRLGWCVVGPTGATSSNNNIKCNLTMTKYHVADITSGTMADHHFSKGTTVCDKIISNSLMQMYNHEFNEVDPEERGQSREDEKFLAILNDGIKKVDGHYEVPLPFRQKDVLLPNNKTQALYRLQSVKNRMRWDTKYKHDYVQFMFKLVNKGYARQCSSVSMVPEGKLWYLCHHGVYHPKKNSIRVVFDCSARFHGRSLNDELIQGPDLTNHLPGVLIRFREELVPFTADIEAMFHQITVPADQRSFLRFLWWPDGNVNESAIEFEMCVHIFGAVSSPSCANFTLKYNANENRYRYGSDAANTVLRNFYVDDLLKSTKTTTEATGLLKRVSLLCSEGGFNLTKVMSRSLEVITSVPTVKQSASARQLEMSKSLPVERALGVIWHVTSDTLSFHITIEDTPLSRRGILSTISSCYDPVGVVSPFLLKGRKILQLITADHFGWDDEVTPQQRSAWEDWRKDLPLLNKLQIDRCYKPDSFADVVEASTHHFGDGSKQIGYGTCHYLRLVNDKGQIHVSLVMAKSRVSPLKEVTIPRIELTSSKTAAEVGAKVKSELDLNRSSDHYWSDSMVTLGYIHNEKKRFRIYVANRVARIRSLTNKEQWHYVESSSNPADLASRGISPKEQEKVKTWFRGPEFLWKSESEWDDQILIPDIDDSDVEVKTSVKVNTTKIVNENDLLTHLERLSRWGEIVRVLAFIMKFIQIKVNKSCQSKKHASGNLLSVTNIKDAELVLLRMIQEKYLKKEVNFYKKNNISHQPKKQRKLEGNLWKLDPFVDDTGLLKVGGRMRKSAYSDEMKHPTILPKKSPLVQHLIEHIHRRTAHGGRGATLNAMRSSGYWVISGATCVKQIIFQCVPCRKYRGKLGEQKMADLPEERVTETAPFTNCGVDMFGPFFIKDGRKVPKRYVALFTCLSSRAIHLEVTSELSTDTFILALRRFLARRGPVECIRSDNGTNFVGTHNEFEKAYNEMDHSKINDLLTTKSCDWIRWERNPPEASHFGGVWERQIRTVRKVLTSLLDEHANTLSDESLRTLLAETEAIVNSRPLTTDGLSDPSIVPISPQQLLTLKTRVVLPPPGVFQKGDNYCRRRWRHIQHLANEFWSRWRKEYLSELQQRQKWVSPKRNFKVDDIVILKDNNTRRQEWPLGRIVKVFTDPTDSLVRSVELRTSTSLLKRPVQKLVLLVEAPDDSK